MWLQAALCFVCDSWRKSDNRNVIFPQLLGESLLPLSLFKQTSAYEHGSWLEYRTEMKPHTFGAKPFVSRHYLMYVCAIVSFSSKGWYLNKICFLLTPRGSSLYEFTFLVFKWIVHPKSSPSGHPRCRRVCFFMGTDLENITSFAHQWIL